MWHLILPLSKNGPNDDSDCAAWESCDPVYTYDWFLT